MATNRSVFKHPINPDLERVEQDGALPTLPIEVQQNIAGFLDSQSVGCLSRSFSGFYAFNEDRLLYVFLKAVVNDDRETAGRMLESRPDLLLMTPPKGMTVKTLAWQTFYAEAAPLMAAKRGQIEMLKMMRPYFDRLPDQEKVNTTLSAIKEAWAYQSKKNGQGVDQIMIPEAYTYYANKLVDAFIEQPIQNNANLSASAQSAFLAFFNMLLPKGAVHLDNYINPGVLLLALLNTYRDHFNHFQYWDQRSAFCVRIIGLAQSVLSVEDAKIFCEGLYQVVGVIGNRKELSTRAKQLKLDNSQTSFYPLAGRPNVDSTTGLGFQFLCGFYSGSFARDLESEQLGCLFLLKSLCLTKTAIFEEYYPAFGRVSNPTCRRA